MTFIRVNSSTYKKVIEELKAGRKISAIKVLRNDSGTGLKDSKLACERLEHEIGLKDHPHSQKEGAKIVAGPVIKKMVLDYGSGDIELDVEGMQLRALMAMQEIGLDACRDILDLVEVIQAFSDGKRVGILDEEEA